MRHRHARRIKGFGLTSADAARLMRFYVMAFDAQLISSEHLSGAPFEKRMGVRSGALCHTIGLGEETIELLQFDTPGRPYPRLSSPYDPTFQHFALVVSDMHLALARLEQTLGWTPISTGGPQHLPLRSGGVTAFKFQDPDGHPLELLEFPEHAVPPHWKKRRDDKIFLGIDHSAISVRNTAASAAFYASLGFRITAQTCNHGEAQAQLDGVPRPEIEVTALSLAVSTPHLELLCYRAEVSPPPRLWASNDVAATRIVFTADELADDTPPQLMIDPDGHHLLLPVNPHKPRQLEGELH